jgi:hypothetical protein
MHPARVSRSKKRHCSCKTASSNFGNATTAQKVRRESTISLDRWLTLRNATREHMSRYGSIWGRISTGNLSREPRNGGDGGHSGIPSPSRRNCVIGLTSPLGVLESSPRRNPGRGARNVYSWNLQQVCLVQRIFVRRQEEAYHIYFPKWERLPYYEGIRCWSTSIEKQ